MKAQPDIKTTGAWISARPLLIAGPCSAESEEQVLATARAIAAIKRDIIFRAGIWKPRTRPDAFEGVGAPGLRWMQRVKQETGLQVATEVANATHVEECLSHGIDVLWVGARTTVNPFSVQEIADALRGTDIPVLVKNPVNPDLQLWIGALERLDRAGITKLAAVHRGFHSNEPSSFRNVPRWEIPIELKTLCPSLPFICDPSHICGNTDLIPYIAQKALDMDMQGLMIETHIMPAVAKSDAKQQLTPPRLAALLELLVVRSARPAGGNDMNRLEELRESINRSDEELLQVLIGRMKAAEQIGLYKKQNKVTILQAGRWEQVINDRLAAAGMLGLSSEFVKKLYTLIHEESIRKQEEIMND